MESPRERKCNRSCLSRLDCSLVTLQTCSPMGRVTKNGGSSYTSIPLHSLSCQGSGLAHSVMGANLCQKIINQSYFQKGSGDLALSLSLSLSDEASQKISRGTLHSTNPFPLSRCLFPSSPPFFHISRPSNQLLWSTEASRLHQVGPLCPFPFFLIL